VTDHAADDEAIAFTPITVPDRTRAKRRTRLLAGGAAVLVVAGGITTWAVAANGGDGKPKKHTAVVPKAFGAYTEAKDGDTEWTRLSSVNTDVTKGPVDLTYRAGGGKAAMITVSLDPADYDNGQTDYGPGSAAMTSSLLGTEGSEKITAYSAGKQGGKIQCADISAGGATITNCAWQSKAAVATFSPVLNHRTVVDHAAYTTFRAFLDALTIEPKNN